MVNEEVKKKVQCSDCDRLFRDRYNLWRHFIRKHVPGKDKINKPKAERLKPTCPHCGQAFYKNGNLKRHSNFCKETKPKPSSYEKLTFNKTSEFEEWKQRTEAETNARFVKKSHYKLLNGSFRTKYCCNRSGFFKPQGKNLRRLKTLGSNKINAVCPAKIISIMEPDGKVEVSFFPGHNGHHMELQRIHLTKSERAEIADKIAKNIPFKDILQNIRNSLPETRLKRIHLLTKKDLYNIGKEFNISSSMPCSYNNINIENFICESANAINSVVEPLEFINKPNSTLELANIQESTPAVLDSTPSDVIRSPEQPSDHSPEAAEDGIPETRQTMLLVQIPYAIEVNEQHFRMDELQEKNETDIEKLKEDMRREFELVLSSIENTEQAQNGKKWLYSFHSFVHSTHVPFQIEAVETLNKL